MRSVRPVKKARKVAVYKGSGIETLRGTNVPHVSMLSSHVYCKERAAIVAACKSELAPTLKSIWQPRDKHLPASLSRHKGQMQHATIPCIGLHIPSEAAWY